MTFGTINKPFTASILALLASYAVGCAATPPPPELVDARAAYIRAESGPAALLKPDSLHVAKAALDEAEKSYADDPGAAKTRDLSYVAVRRAELAEVEARNAKAAQDKSRAEKELVGLTEVQLSHTRQQLASASERLTGTEQLLAMREATDKRAQEAIDKVSASAAGSVMKDARGTVITIPGSVLFASGKTALLAGAQAKLNTVASALKEQAERGIVVEVHTDSQGTEASNLELSQGRAQHVRDYLVAHGVPANRIRAQGLGESQPIADNNSPAGRASNRRIEIIVSLSDGTSDAEHEPTTQGNPPTNRK
jgi:outer membrane protein OmpA-like peptidoglycan-associated protein